MFLPTLSRSEVTNWKFDDKFPLEPILKILRTYSGKGEFGLPLISVAEVGNLDATQQIVENKDGVTQMIDFQTDFLSDSIVVIKARGKLDESTRKYFFSCISDLMREADKMGTSQHVIVECNGLGSLSSSGMAALLTARTRIRKGGGKIYFTHLSSTITAALELTKLNKLLAIYPTTEELLREITKKDQRALKTPTAIMAHE